MQKLWKFSEKEPRLKTLEVNVSATLPGREPDFSEVLTAPLFNKISFEVLNISTKTFEKSCILYLR